MKSALDRNYLRSRTVIAGAALLFISLCGAMLSWMPIRDQAVYDSFAKRYVHLTSEVSVIGAEAVRLAYDPWPERRLIARSRIVQAKKAIAAHMAFLNSLNDPATYDWQIFGMGITATLIKAWHGEQVAIADPSGVHQELSELIHETERLLSYPTEQRFRARQLALAISERAERHIAPELEDSIRVISGDRQQRTGLILRTVIGSFAAIVVALAVIGLVIIQPTERAILRAQEDLHRARDRAEAADKAKSAFLASMSHEIRTPMNGVLGMTASLLSDPLTPRQRDKLLIIKESGDALLTLIDDILDISKIEAGVVNFDRCSFSLSRLLESLELLWRSRATAKKLGFTLIDRSDDAEVLCGDPSRLRQILNNLLGNAIKFTESGKVTLSVDVEAARPGHRRLTFSVRDTGIGLSEEQQKKLFRPFAQADSSTTRRFGGTGLGLAICKQLVELQGGEIQLSSHPNQGTVVTFSLTLPLGDPEEVEEPPPVPEMRALPRLAGGRAPRILLAEDNNINQRVVANLLHPLDCELVIVGDGKAAVEAAEQGDFDLILMDVQMPVLDGPAATRALRSHPDPAVASLPIVALTANAMKGDREIYLAAGMSDYISKPIDQGELRACLQRWLGITLGDAAPTAAVPESDREPAESAALSDLLAKVKAAG